MSALMGDPTGSAPLMCLETGDSGMCHWLRTGVLCRGLGDVCTPEICRTIAVLSLSSTHCILDMLMLRTFTSAPECHAVFCHCSCTLLLAQGLSPPVWTWWKEPDYSFQQMLLLLLLVVPCSVYLTLPPCQTYLWVFKGMRFGEEGPEVLQLVPRILLSQKHVCTVLWHSFSRAFPPCILDMGSYREAIT